MFGDILPSALGIAVSPVPVIATILMLLSPRPKAKSVAFSVGWVVGILLAVTMCALFAGLLPDRGAESGGVVAGILRLTLGVLMAVLAIRIFRRRPKAGEEPKLPKWMTAIDEIRPVVALGLAAALVLANPKNLLLAASAGIALGGIGRGDATIVAYVVFVLIASSTVLIPVVGYACASARLAVPLDRLRDWLTHHNSIIMSLLLAFLAFSNVGAGIDAL